MEATKADVNRVLLVGYLESWFTFDHKVKEELFFLSYILVHRLSGTVDRIPVCIKSSLLEDLDSSILGKKVRIYGHIVTNNINGKTVIKVRVVSILAVDESEEETNEVIISGKIMNHPYLRITSSGKEICDLVIYSRRLHNKFAYIPAIAWNCTAKYIIKKPEGSNIFIKARFQSRKNWKYLECGRLEENVVYELAVFYVFCYPTNNSEVGR